MLNTQLFNWSLPSTLRTRSPTIARAASTVIEDYLKVIYAHTEWQSEPMTSSQLAARLGLVPSTVTEMVKKLCAAGLVEHAPYGAVTLTDAGRADALRMVRRHRIVETWLVRQFNYSWDEVHDEAEQLEHILSDRLLDAIDGQLGRPHRDPHGDPIPAADGTVFQPDAVMLSELSDGVSARVVRISDHDPELLRQLASAGVALDASVTGGELDLEQSRAIWVVRPEKVV